jgi:hypothetical protein
MDGQPPPLITPTEAKPPALLEPASFPIRPGPVTSPPLPPATAHPAQPFLNPVGVAVPSLASLNMQGIPVGGLAGLQQVQVPPITQVLARAPK